MIDPSQERPLRRHCRRFAASCAAMLLGTLAACSHLQVEPAHAASISGDWVLDPAASDDFDALVKRAIDAQEQKLRKQRQRSMNIGDRDVPPLGMLPPEEPATVHDRLAEQLRPADTLKLIWQDGTLEISANGEPPRSFVPGHSVSRMDTAGTGVISSGWEGDRFDLRTKYEGNESRLQSFALDAQGRLVVTLQVQGEAVNKLLITSRYKRSG